MSILRNRIARVGQYSPDLTIIGTNNGPESIPDSRITMTEGTLAYEDTQVFITPDGRPVPASTPGSWGSLYAAGNIS